MRKYILPVLIFGLGIGLFVFYGCIYSPEKTVVQEPSQGLPPWVTVEHFSMGKVVGISDGDTVTILTDDKQTIKVRLAEIDCPEKKQAFGTKARQVLADKIFNKEVKVEGKKKDLYGRVIGQIYLENRWINKEMIEEGWAWHYKQYSHSPELAAVQEHAKTNKLGLWQDANPIPPWEYRKKK